jgi:type I restriction enzyme S subunit
LRRYISSSKISAISTEKLGKVFIPVPSLERQLEVANILDELDEKLVRLLEKLTSEKKARREQYIHYKQRVLTFQKIVAS